jgi:hypothetical protein
VNHYRQQILTCDFLPVETSSLQTLLSCFSSSWERDGGISWCAALG